MAEAELPGEIADHYESIDESSRLRQGEGVLEEARTRILIERYAAPPPAIVLDIGGGPGVYAHWLSGLGYEVHLRDPVAKHIDQARAASSAGTPLASAEVGDARRIDYADASVDVVMMLGPLYHLTEGHERATALGEAARVLRPGGLLVAAAISRFASLLDGLWRNLIADPAFGAMLERDLTDGQHRNPTGDPTYFTTAFFHRPEELKAEIAAAGFEQPQVLAVEGVGWIMPDFEERFGTPEGRRLILEAVARTEREPAILGVSQHLLGLGYR